MFPKIRGTLLGVPIIRTIVFWGLYWGSQILGNYHIGEGLKHHFFLVSPICMPWVHSAGATPLPLRFNLQQFPIYWVPVLKSLYKYILSITQGPTIWVPGLLGRRFRVACVRLTIGASRVQGLDASLLQIPMPYLWLQKPIVW